MTISTETARVLYNGDDSTTTFPITFTRQVDGDVRVVLRDSSDVETLQVDATDYNIVADDVEMVVAPATGEKLLLVRGTALTQTTDYPTDGAFPSASHEAALDKLTMQMQLLDERLDRGIILKETSSFVNLELPEPVASNILAWNSGATALENITAVSIDAIVMPGTTVVGNIPTFVDTAGGGFKDSGVHIAVSGNMGLGTTSPGALFELSGADTAIIRLTNTDTSITANQLLGKIEWFGNDSGGPGGAPGVVASIRSEAGNSEWGGSSSDGAEIVIATASVADGLTDRLTISATGNIVINTGQLANNATNGFLYIPTTTSGAPTGTPTTFNGRVPMVYDDTNDDLYIYRGGWKKIATSYV